MTARGEGPAPPELRNTGPRGVPTYPLGIAERRHRNLPSVAKEHNPAPRVPPPAAGSRPRYAGAWLMGGEMLELEEKVCFWPG